MISQAAVGAGSGCKRPGSRALSGLAY
uniref:Uncharacterized protein n=1 Tax=Arundo donax TaxID=35708 RepID=A0A0A9AZU9_ARUDO